MRFVVKVEAVGTSVDGGHHVVTGLAGEGNQNRVVFVKAQQFQNRSIGDLLPHGQFDVDDGVSVTHRQVFQRGEVGLAFDLT